ncbi:MAG: phosphatidylserine decarboxylase [Sulfuricurvum sp.]|jgi:phosphatidylserine decarboxylase|uniref:phosphatidylserine decarboxylase n=1 Tax=Sulfuricurvum sp. TaxID=2025608 RepID=UPI00262A1A19|nr:phosphatidylserine decarboxylase [Sulfuricurvum sp.]MDD2828857.1 phosphatidylserine decarboxylase [Sulfuricurvum sp.]MDD4948520.1 phosphatidylserine decarboxylase [Sulfuricurvum sp.]
MSVQNDTFILSKQGWLPIALAGTLFIFFSMTALHLFQFIFGALLIAFLILFRNPERSAALGETSSIISSVDGVVLGIEETLINDKTMKKVTILNSLWNVSMLRAPFDGVMEWCKVRHGVSLGLYHPLAEMLNEKILIAFKSLSGHEVFIEHTSAQSCFSIAVENEEAQKMKEGSRYGFLARGRTVMYIPNEVTLNVHAGADVRAGESVIGRFDA